MHLHVQLNLLHYWKCDKEFQCSQYLRLLWVLFEHRLKFSVIRNMLSTPIRSDETIHTSDSEDFIKRSNQLPHGWSQEYAGLDGLRLLLLQWLARCCSTWVQHYLLGIGAKCWDISLFAASNGDQPYLINYDKCFDHKSWCYSNHSHIDIIIVMN